jgi:peptidoglycan/xylan/chitin deacetylase (PgdA/CDA1 family)
LDGLAKLVTRAALETLYFSGGHHVLRPFVGGVGAILALHHVRPPRVEAFQPNRHLEVSPAFLEDVILRLPRATIDIVSLHELHRRLVSCDFRRRFVAVTIDDGYRDTLEWAYPILRKHRVPFTVYIPTSFPDRLGELWWIVLERVIARNSRIGLIVEGENCHFECRTVDEKREVFASLHSWLCNFADEQEMRAVVGDLAARHDVDARAPCRELCMSWLELSRLAADPLVTVGAHTVNRPMLSRVTDHVARSEMEMGAAVIEATFGTRPCHLSFPGGPRAAGAREFRMAAALGFKTAVTSRAGVLFPEHRHHLTALPRITLNGNFARLRYFDVFVSGAATAFKNAFHRLDVT